MKKRFLVFLLPVLMLSGCSILDQVSQMAALSECEFRLDGVSNVTVLGIRMDNKEDISDFSFTDLAKLTAAVSGGSLPLAMVLDVEVKNPNTQTAAMSRLDWQIYVDGEHMLDGVVNERVTIPANGGKATVPFNASIDLKDILQGNGLDAAINLAMNLSGHGSEPSKLKLKVKPTILVAGRTIAYPGYITVEEEF